MSIPLKIRASSAVARGERYTGELPLAGLHRLGEALAETQGVLHVDLRGEHDAQGHPALGLRVAADLRLTCQRCLAPFSWTLELHEVLRLVQTEQDETRLLHECEPYRVHDDCLPLHEIVEDEVMLVLPMLPRCESCENAVRTQGEPEGGGDKPNPFAQLKQLKFKKS